MTSLELTMIILIAVGVFFMVVSAIGILRLPDVYTRMHAATKATTLGISCILIATGLHYGGWDLVRMFMLIGLFFVTAPVAATNMARAAYRTDFEHQLVLNYNDLAAHEAGDPGTLGSFDKNPDPNP